MAHLVSSEEFESFRQEPWFQVLLSHNIRHVEQLVALYKMGLGRTALESADVPLAELAVLAEDGYLPRGLALLNPKTSVPMRSILFCAILYGALSWFSFSELITANAFLYGLSIMLEMLALMILRRREPELERPFKIPGGMPVLVLMLVLPMVLIGLLSFTTVREEGWLKQLPSVVAIFLGIVVYRVATTRQSRLQSAEDR